MTPRRRSGPPLLAVKTLEQVTADEAAWLRGTAHTTGAVPLPAASVDVGQAAVLVPEYGRSVVSTQQEGIVKMAQQIVGLMEEPW